MVILAFYKGSSTLSDRGIQFVTRGTYSHCEMISGLPLKLENGMHRAESWSSSGRDGGVRGKVIDFDPDKWDLLAFELGDPSCVDLIKAYDGAKYDWLGVGLTHLINLRRHHKSRWFCSEICAMALGLPDPHTYSPSSLYRKLEWINENAGRFGKVGAA